MLPALLLIPLLAFAPDVPSAGESKPDLARTAEKLVRQLGDAELTVRDAAEQALLQLGPEVLPLLPSANLTGEKKERIERVRQALQRTTVEAAASPSLVTLMGELTPAEAFAALEKQSGVKITAVQLRGGDKLTLNLKNKTFWEAFDEIVDLADLAAQSAGGEKGLIVAPRVEGQASRRARAAYSGVFRFEPIRVTAVRDLRIPQIQTLRLGVDISWEPRVQPIVLELPLSSLEAADHRGKPLDLSVKAGSISIVSEGAARSGAEVDLPLKLPDRDVRRIGRLAGSLTALLPGRIETFTFTDLGADAKDAKDREQRRAGVTVSVVRAVKNQDLYELRILVRFDEAAGALESHRNWIDNNEAYILDADGKRIEPAAFESGARKENEQQLAYIFPLEKGFAGCKFMYKTPALLVKKSIPFELRDIDLP